MNEKCICCVIREINFSKRMLCTNCYQSLQRRGLLSEFPPIALPPSESLWVKKYGEEILSDLQGLVDEHHKTLSAVGRKYGISKERVRQMFELVYGFKYTVIVTAKRDKKRRIKFEKVLKSRDPRYKVEHLKKGSFIYRGAESEKKVFDICSALNYEIKPYHSQTIDLIINGYNVEIKSAHRVTFTSKKQKTPTFHFKLLPSQRTVDFVVCHAVPTNQYFVIPIHEYPTSGNLYIPKTRTMEWTRGKTVIKRVSRYYDYLEAWHLLKPKEEIIFNKPALVAREGQPIPTPGADVNCPSTDGQTTSRQWSGEGSDIRCSFDRSISGVA